MSARRASRWLARGVAVPAVVVVALSAAACSRGDSAGAAADVAVRFHVAVAHHRGADACALLAPETVGELEQQAQGPCRGAVLREDVPDVAAVRSSQMFGTEAQVQFDSDTVFLAEFPDGWKVVAAACKPREALPYDCRIQGL